MLLVLFLLEFDLSSMVLEKIPRNMDSGGRKKTKDFDFQDKQNPEPMFRAKAPNKTSEEPAETEI